MNLDRNTVNDSVCCAGARGPGRWSGCGAAAFTVLELLVVVGILAVLAGLVLSAVGRSKSRTHTVVCLANLKQLALAFHAYAEDGDGAFPTAIWRPPSIGGATNVSFDDLLCPLLGVRLTPAEQLGDRIPLAKRTKLLTCPADTIAPAFPTANTWRRTYSMSEARMVSGPVPLMSASGGGVGVCHSIAWGAVPTVDKPAVLRMSAVPEPANTLTLVERPNPVNYAGNDHWAVTRRTGEQRNGFPSASFGRQYHGGRFNYLFCDGRAELLAPEMTWGRTGSDTAWAGAWTLQPGD